jgi:putative protease
VEFEDGFNYFIPSSLLSELRRQLVEQLMACSASEMKKTPKPMKTNESDRDNEPSYSIPYLYNISNRLSADFYGVKSPSAFEIASPSGLGSSPLLMQCRYCLRYELGYCVKHGGKRPEWREPLYLRLSDGHRFRLEFDCKHCQMNVYAE